MIEPMIKWLRASYNGYNISSCGLQLASKLYADDGTLVTNTVDDMIFLLNLVDQFNKWFGILLNVNKCKITAFIQEIQSMPR